MKSILWLCMRHISAYLVDLLDLGLLLLDGLEGSFLLALVHLHVIIMMVQHRRPRCEATITCVQTQQQLYVCPLQVII